MEAAELEQAPATTEMPARASATPAARSAAAPAEADPVLLVAAGVLALGTVILDLARLPLLLVAAGFLVMAYGAGVCVERAAGPLVSDEEDRAGTSVVVALAIRLAIGVACVALVSMAAAFLGVLWLAAAVAGLFIANGVLELIRTVRTLRVERVSGVSWAGGLAVGSLWLVAWLWGTIPPVFYDELVYHLVIPQRTLATGEALTERWNLFTLMPHASDLLLGWGMALSGELGARAVHVTVWMICTLAALGLVDAIAHPASRDMAGLMVPFALAACPTLWFVATLTFAEASLAMALVAAMAVLGVSRSAVKPWLALGILLGLAATVKLTGLYWAAAGLVAAALAGWPLRAVATAAGVVLVSILPWWARAFAHTGNPVYPMASWLWSGETWGAENQARVIGDVAKSVLDMDILAVLRLPVDLLRHPEYFGAASDLGMLALVAVGLTLAWPVVGRFAGAEPRLVRLGDAVAAFMVVAGIGWSVTSTTTRFFAPGLVLGLVALVGAASVLPRGARIAVLVLVLITGVSGTWRFLDHHATVFSSGAVALGREAADRYLARQLDPYDAARFVRAEVPAHAKLLFIGETRTYYFFRDALAPSAYDRHPLQQWVEESDSAGTLAERLAREGITHVVLNIREFERLHESYDLLTFDGMDAPVKDRRLKELPRALRPLFSRNGVYVFAVPASRQVT